MTFKSIKTMAAVAALITGVTGAAFVANAQTPVQVALTTNSAITVVDIRDMAFGTWLLVFRNADAFSLVMDTTGTITPTGLAGGPTNSIALNLVSANQTARVSANLPAGANGVQINMQRDAIIDMPDLGLTFVSPTYATVTEGANQALPLATNVPVTVVLGGTAEVVDFGGTIDVSATPANATHTASFNVTFAY